MNDLVGATEIARRLNTTRAQVVHSWRRRDPTFPEPIAHLERALVWDWRDIERWAQRTGRL